VRDAQRMSTGPAELQAAAAERAMIGDAPAGR
jgi:hypothetical protein